MGQEIILYLGAIALGALHAFEPGHGKTIIAAYMIGSRGRALDGMLLGLIVTFTHTFSVIILGIIAKMLSDTYSDEQLHGWLGLFSAIIILAVGLWMLRQRLSGSSGHHHFHLFGKGHHHHDDHSSDHDHTLDHTDTDDHHTHSRADHDHRQSHQAHGNAHSQDQLVKHDKMNLLLLGISGGLVPCPAALAALIAAIGSGMIAKGLTMVLFFSLGLGLVMMTIGVALAHAGKFTKKLNASPDFSRRMGIVSAIIITILGTVTLINSVDALWFS